MKTTPNQHIAGKRVVLSGAMESVYKVTEHIHPHADASMFKYIYLYTCVCVCVVDGARSTSSDDATQRVMEAMGIDPAVRISCPEAPEDDLKDGFYIGRGTRSFDATPCLIACVILGKKKKKRRRNNSRSIVDRWSFCLFFWTESNEETSEERFGRLYQLMNSGMQETMCYRLGEDLFTSVCLLVIGVSSSGNILGRVSLETRT